VSKIDIWNDFCEAINSQIIAKILPKSTKKTRFFDVIMLALLLVKN